MAEDRRDEKQALGKLLEAAARRGVDLPTLIEELTAEPQAAEPKARQAPRAPSGPELSGWQLGMVRAVQLEAAKVFGSAEAGRDFMEREHGDLGGRQPVAVAAESPEGAERVLRTLGRIKYQGGVRR